MSAELTVWLTLTGVGPHSNHTSFTLEEKLRLLALTMFLLINPWRHLSKAFGRDSLFLSVFETYCLAGQRTEAGIVRQTTSSFRCHIMCEGRWKLTCNLPQTPETPPSAAP